MIKVLDITINEKNIASWIKQYEGRRQVELLELEAFYLGKDKIGKVINGSKRMNNNVHSSLAYMITKNATDYFIGKPLSYSFDEGFSAAEYIKTLSFDNLEDSENKEIAKDCSKFGKGFELMNVNENGDIYFKRLDPIYTFDVYDTSIIPEKVATITYLRFLNNFKRQEIKGYIYTREEILEFKKEVASSPKVDITAGEINVFGKIPVIYYLNNSDMVGDFERVSELLTAYNKLLSCAVDDYESISNAILMIKEAKKIPDEQKDSFNSTRVIQLFSENAEMAFINKTLDSTFVNTLREALKEDILTITNVPDFTDKNFAGDSSGIALEYKLIGFENLRADKEIYFKQAIMRRWDVISLYPAERYEIKKGDITINMYPNLPTNIERDLKLAELVNSGGISKRTGLENMQIVGDVDEELNRIAEEKPSVEDINTSLDLRV